MPLPHRFGQEKLPSNAASWPEGAFKYTATAVCDFCSTQVTYEFISSELPLATAFVIARTVLSEGYGYQHPLTGTVGRAVERLAKTPLSPAQKRALFKHILGKRNVACRGCHQELLRYVTIYFAHANALTKNVTPSKE